MASPPRITSILCGTSIVAVALCGLMFYLVFIILVMKIKRFHKSYYLLAATLGIADCTSLLIKIVYVGPSIMRRENLTDHRMVGGLLNVAWFSALPFFLFLAGDRYLCICKSELHDKIYSRRMVIIYCIACWIFGLTYSLPSFFSCCPLNFSISLMSWGWLIELPGAKILSYGELIMVVTVTTVTYTLNGLVICDIRKRHRNVSTSAIDEHRKSKRERKIFTQFFISTVWLIIFDVPFITLGYIPEPSYWLGYFVTMAYTINCSINGWVYVCMNKLIQKELKNAIFGRARSIRGRSICPPYSDNESPGQSQGQLEARRL